METKHTPDVDRVVEQVTHGNVFSGDWHTLRLMEIERDELRQQNEGYNGIAHDLETMRQQNKRLVEALRKAAAHLDEAAMGVDDDHPMHKHFIVAAQKARAALASVEGK